jgi:hypothetical protein
LDNINDHQGSDPNGGSANYHHRRANTDDGVFDALDNNTAGSDWIVAKRASGQDLRHCLAAERTGDRP